MAFLCLSTQQRQPVSRRCQQSFQPVIEYGCRDATSLADVAAGIYRQSQPAADSHGSRRALSAAVRLQNGCRRQESQQPCTTSAAQSPEFQPNSQPPAAMKYRLNALRHRFQASAGRFCSMNGFQRRQPKVISSFWHSARASAAPRQPYAAQVPQAVNAPAEILHFHAIRR